jgi:hypothetical protein
VRYRVSCSRRRNDPLKQPRQRRQIVAATLSGTMGIIMTNTLNR